MHTTYYSGSGILGIYIAIMRILGISRRGTPYPDYVISANRFLGFSEEIHESLRCYWPALFTLRRFGSRLTHELQERDLLDIRDHCQGS